ncbi:MAG: flagellin, partial [Roseibium sp.]
MSFTQVGDLAQQHLMRRHNTLLTTQLNTLTLELASGKKSDVPKSLGGDFGLLGDVERSLSLLSGYETATNDAQIFSDTVQTVLTQMQPVSGDLATSLDSTASAGLPAPVSSVIAEARQDFDAIVSALNSDVAGRGLFAGAATDRPALASSDVILDALSTALSGAASQDDILDVVDDWFMSDAGGFETIAYLGSENSLAPFQLTESDSVRHELRADHSEIRGILRDTALAVMVGDKGLGLELPDKSQLLRVAGERLLSQQDGLTRIRSDLGFVQERIGEAIAKNASTKSSLEITRNNLVTADPFDTATRLEAAQVQLETLYTVTAR